VSVDLETCEACRWTRAVSKRHCEGCDRAADAMRPATEAEQHAYLAWLVREQMSPKERRA
jgi:hypothetical protein